MLCIKARLRLEREKEQQETLILSVIPAHIGRWTEAGIGMELFLSMSFSDEHEIRNVTQGERYGEVSSFAIT